MHIPRKRFGQHFLSDAGVIREIVGSIAPCESDLVVEIGPGLGALTQPLMSLVPKMHAVEIDRDIVAALRDFYPIERLVVHEGDALDFDFAFLGRPVRVVGNLPYNISTPFLFHLATQSRHVQDGHFMLQKEVVDRMVAIAGDPAYGRLSVMLQYRFSIEKLFEVGPGSFRPPPKVQSAVIRLLPISQPRAVVKDGHVFARLVAHAFSRRRKMLKNAFEGYLDQDAILSVGLDPEARPETIDVEGFVRAANHVATARGAVE